MGGRKDVVVGDCKYGTSFDADQWVSLDPCGLAGCSCSFSIHIFALITIYGYLIYNSYTAQILFYFIYIPASLLALTSLFKAWTTNPGAVPMGARPLVTVKRAGSSSITAEATESNNNNNNETSSDNNNPQPNDSSTKGGSRRMKRRERGLRRCHKCNDNYKPNRAHHDSVTGRCIVKMDHFCPWVGNAIGALNHKFFVLFIFYTMCTTLLSLLLLLLRAIHCGFYAISDDSNSADNDITTAPQMMTSTTTATSSGEYVRETANEVIHQQEEDIEMDNVDPMLLQKVLLAGDGGNGGGGYEVQYCNDLYTSKCVLLLLVISFIFLIFTSCMLVEQIEAITTNTGKIARMKMRVGNAGSSEFAPVTQEFNEMFGGNTPNITWHWFLPISITFHPRSMKKVILGYDYDESCSSNPTTPYQEPNVTHNSNNINNCCVTTDHNAITNNINGNNDGNNNNIMDGAPGRSNNDSDTQRTSSLTLDDNNNDNNRLSVVPAAQADQDSSSDVMEEIMLTSSPSVRSDNGGSGSDVESGLQSRQKIKKRANSRGTLEIV